MTPAPLTLMTSRWRLPRRIRKFWNLKKSSYDFLYRLANAVNRNLAHDGASSSVQPAPSLPTMQDGHQQNKDALDDSTVIMVILGSLLKICNF